MDVSLKLEISSRAWIFSDDPFVNPCVDLAVCGIGLVSQP